MKWLPKSSLVTVVRSTLHHGGDFSAGPFPSFDKAVDALESDLGTTDGGMFDDEFVAENYMKGLHADGEPF